MALGMAEAFLRAVREPVHRLAWRVFGACFFLICLTLGRQSVQNLVEGGLPSHLSLGGLWSWGLVILLLLLITVGFNRAQSRSRHPWIALLDGAVFTVALNQMLWLWIIQPIAQRAELPWPHRVGVIGIFGLAATSVGLSLHVLAKRGSFRGPLGVFSGALIWITILLPWWVKINFLQELRPAHPMRLLLLGAFLLLWGVVRTPWSAGPGQPRRLRPWLVNLLPYLPAGFAFFGAFIHSLVFPATPDWLNTSLLGSLAFLVLLRQTVAFHEIWRLKQTLEDKVETRTRELAESSRLLLQTQRMNLIATLGAGVAHDLNNLICAASLNLDLMEAEGHGAAGAAAQGRMATLRVALSKAGELTQRLMSVGAEEAKAKGLVELAGHLRGLEPVLQALVPRNTQLVIEPGEGALCVPGHSGLIDQLVVNLVMNARDATRHGGSIRVTAEALGASQDEGDSVCLSVVDTGVGIAPDHLDRIFEPFFSTKGPGNGTGLGLGAVKAVVDGLGGTIQVHSVVGQGTRFAVHLPRVPSDR
jgi:signal transduction histidine kinase